MSSAQIIVTQAGGAIAFGSVGAGYGTALAVTGTVRKLIFASTLDQECVVSLDGGTTNWMVFPANFTLTIDLNPDMQYSGTISVKHNGVAPLSGKFIVAVIRTT